MGEWHYLYNSKAWRRRRRLWLQHQPFCQECQKQSRLVFGNVVDHVIPHKGDLSLFWDIDNLQTLCSACHGVKSEKEKYT